MKRLIAATALTLLPLVGIAGEEEHLQSANIDLHDQAALQRGAKYFFNYCSGCHSLEYARYNRMAHDIGLTEAQVNANLMFVPGTKVGDNIKVSMTQKEGDDWFGNAPPDLTLVAKYKEGGPDWIYTYLKSFYLDPKRPWGVNNTVFPNVAMPDILWQVQGTQKAVYREGKDAAGHPIQVLDHLTPATPGTMTPKELDGMVRDITTFLAYMGEPGELEHQALGRWVILFLVVFTVLAYLLKKEYWRDVH
jgi:ubiquinol-cytochrome c reductase cytochrome c1 subunit